MRRNTVTTLSFVVAIIAAISSGLPLAQAADSCQPVFDALTKVVTTPSHSYTTHTASFLKDGKPQSSETIYVQGEVYIRVDGKWRKSPVRTEEVLEQEKENREHGKATCQFLRNEFVGAEPAMVYSIHREYEGNKEDGQVWISKSTGLLLRSDQDVDAGGTAGKDHRSARFEYGEYSPSPVKDTSSPPWAFRSLVEKESQQWPGFVSIADRPWAAGPSA